MVLQLAELWGQKPWDIDPSHSPGWWYSRWREYMEIKASAHKPLPAN
jgi:hypothetical protein